MTTTIAYATGDGYIRSSSTVYSTAQSGSGLTVFGSDSFLRVGQDKVGSTFFVYEAFLAFPYTLDTNVQVVTAYVDLFCSFANGTGVQRDVGLRGFSWGSLDTTDWRTMSQITALTRYAYSASVQSANGLHTYSSESPLNGWLDSTTGTKEFVVYNSRMTGNLPPASGEYNDFAAVETGGTSQDPALVYTTVPIHTLVRVGGCETMLSDGQHVYIEANSGGDSPTLTLKRYDGTTHSNIATNLLDGSRDMGFSNESMQQYALVRDASDNIYWMGHAGGGGNTLNVVCWKKTGTNTWSEQPERQANMPTIPGSAIINNVGAAWHSVGTNGTIVVVLGYECVPTDGNPTGEMNYALLNCQYLLTGSGSLLRASGDAYDAGLITPWSNSEDYNQPVNPIGTSLDVVALPNSSTRGVVVSLDRNSQIGDYAPIGIVRYILNSTGTGFSQADDATQDLWSTKDAGAKARVLPISDTRFAVVTLDKDSGWGPTIYVIQNIGTSTTFSTLGAALLHDAANVVTSMPAPSTLHDKFTWDALYHPDANAIYFYYIDQADPDRLMRTTFSLTTYQAVKDEIQVANGTTVAPAGATVHAIRVDRGTLTKSEAMVSIASKTGATQHATLYVKDTLNVAPLAPTLVDRTNYDATQAAVFDWTFNDQNVGDTQSAYQLQIDNADTLANVVDTGKVTSTVSERTVTGGTLTNGINYRWRVRTYDASDLVGAWSVYDFFTTSAGGSLNITNPATDNPAGLINDEYTFVWTVTGMTQAAYRVRVVRTSTGAEVSNTGFITSTNTSHLVTGLLSDVEYRVEITARNSALVETNVAVRLITANYNEPETPTATATPLNDAGYILIDVINPIPAGDRPEVTYNLVQRRRPGESTWTSVAQIGHNGSYQDYATGSGITYEYKIVAVASTGSSESTVYEATLQLMGVWMHVPSDPAGTARNFIFGKDQRGDSLTSYAQLTHFAGREDPVADFAHYTDRVFNVVIDIPFGDDYYDQLDAIAVMATSRQTLVYRDNRHRNAFGVMLSGFGTTDTAVGSQVTFDFTRVDYNEEVV